MTPANFRALKVRNFCLTFENTNSMGLYSGEYGTLKMQRKPNLYISALDFSLL